MRIAMKNNETSTIEVSNVQVTEATEAQSEAQPTLTLTEALAIIPSAMGEKLLGALARKYDQKYGKLPNEQQAHKEIFPQYAGNTAMLYILCAAKQEAEDKLASEERVVNVSNLRSMVNAYTQADVLTEYQDAQNKEIDRQIANLRDKITSPAEHKNVLKSVRNDWVKSIDYGYVRSQDNKMRRACHIFGTTIDAIAR